MKQATGQIEIATSAAGLIEITDRVTAWVADHGFQEGLLTLFCRHTSASLLIQENAASEVKTDLQRYFERIAPEEPSAYAHDDEGPDDMPAHIRTALTGVNLSIPLTGGRLALGTWQGIYLFDGIQSLSRSTYSKLMPETKDTASFFSFYDVTEKVAAVIGIFSFGFINELTGSQRSSVLALMIFFIIGLLLLFYAAALKKKPA